MKTLKIFLVLGISLGMAAGLAYAADLTQGKAEKVMPVTYGYRDKPEKYHITAKPFNVVISNPNRSPNKFTVTYRTKVLTVTGGYGGGPGSNFNYTYNAKTKVITKAGATNTTVSYYTDGRVVTRDAAGNVLGEVYIDPNSGGGYSGIKNEIAGKIAEMQNMAKAEGGAIEQGTAENLNTALKILNG